MIYNDYRHSTRFSYLNHDKSKKILRKTSFRKTPTEAELDLLDKITTTSSSSTNPINIVEVIAEKTRDQP